MGDSPTGEATVTDEPADGTDAVPTTWRDPKRYLWLVGLVVPLMPITSWIQYERTGRTWVWITGPLVVYLLIPLLDRLIGTDTSNPPDAARAALEKDRYYRFCTYAFIPLQLLGLTLVTWEWSKGGHPLVAQVGMILTVGLVSGIGINTAHELGHKSDKLERRLSKVALAPTAYGHFYVEHNRGHHSRVATPEDPASARLGESFWAFLPRTVIGSLTSAWALEKGRLARKGRRTFSPRNNVLNAWALTVLLFGGLTLAFGIGVLPFLVIQAVYGFSLLEKVNYLEHYGLSRQKVANGRYERVKPEHSWNSNNVVTNLALFHLQRHSDHHANPTRRYQVLRHFDEAPELPSGYAALIGLVMVPPLWRRLMDPRVVRHYDGDLSRANVHPPAAEKYLSAA
jgi:alkane 1-monooxygenase